MKHLIRAAIAALLLVAAPAFAQQFPISLPASSVYGRLGITPGPGQAIPFTTLKGILFSATRTQLTGSQNFWVNGDPINPATCGSTGASTCSAGSDSNDCLTAATACLTTQHVIYLILGSYDIAGFSATILLAHNPGTQNYAFTCEAGPFLGQSTVSIFGDTNAPTAVVIQDGAFGGTNAGAVVKDGCTVGLISLAFADNGTNNATCHICVGTGGPGHVDATNITYRALGVGDAIDVTYAGTIQIGGSNFVVGSMDAFINATGGGVADLSGATVTGSPSLTWTTGAVIIQSGGIIKGASGGASGPGSSGATFQGFASISGPRFFSSTEVMSPDLANPNFVFPGSTDGLVSFYVGSLGLQSGSGASSTIAFGTSGQLLTSGGGGVDSWTNIASHLTAGTNISITGTTTATVGVTNNSTTVAGQTCTLGSSCTVATSNLSDVTSTTTWTPTDASGASLSLTVTDARYTRMGKIVVVTFAITYPTTGSGLTAVIGGLPVASFSGTAAVGGGALPFTSTSAATNVLVQNNATQFNFFNTSGSAATNTQMSGATVRGTITYISN